jgi:alanyl-tRNA synthetase
LEKLYYENPYMREFTAEILNVIEKDGNFHIELDKTCFYPRDEYYMGDRGFINSVPVVDVYESDGMIYHVIGVKPLKIHRVKCSIDWKKRFEYMQHHMGMHIISGCTTELFNANTVKSDSREEHFSISIDKIVGEEEINKAEALANKIIHENIAVETLHPTNAELKKMSIYNIYFIILKKG